MDIWNTGKSFKNGSAPATLTSTRFHTRFQSVSSTLSVLLEHRHIVFHCLPLSEPLLEGVPIASFAYSWEGMLDSQCGA